MQYITVDLRDRKQLYEQLIDNIRKLILSGEIKPGEKLPSVRALAKELSINPNTIQKAYNELERQGVILTLPGRGSVVLAETGELRKEQLIRTGNALQTLAREAASTGITGEEFLALAKTAWENNAGAVSNRPAANEPESADTMEGGIR
ncbi:MAG: GntR family transcriptional regulator [Clostridia bacterium]|nr:GntR family transcriptional regulator [Clostridia bacterium]